MEKVTLLPQLNEDQDRILATGWGSRMEKISGRQFSCSTLHLTLVRKIRGRNIAGEMWGGRWPA